MSSASGLNLLKTQIKIINFFNNALLLQSQKYASSTCLVTILNSDIFSLGGYWANALLL